MPAVWPKALARIARGKAAWQQPLGGPALAQRGRRRYAAPLAQAPERCAPHSRDADWLCLCVHAGPPRDGSNERAALTSANRR